MSYSLPMPYRQLGGLIRDVAGGENHAWFGDVGFFVPSGGAPDEAWVEELVRRRWPGMHPDLLPFAHDGADNLYCLHRSARHAMRDVAPVMLWMYETYHAVPVASSFETFVAWLGLTAWTTVRRGSDPVIDAHHFDAAVRPLLERFDLSTEFSVLLPEPYPSNAEVHRAFLKLDPFAPASLVAAGMRQQQAGMGLRGIESVDRALSAFPEFSAAAVARSRIQASLRDLPGELAAVEQALRLPLAYSGDAMMPFLGEVPEVDAGALLETLNGHPLPTDSIFAEPAWELLLYDDPTSPQTWLQVAADWANAGALEESVTLACNALHLSGNGPPEAAMETLSLLLELYEALHWPWHHHIVEQEQAARANRRVPLRRRGR